MDKLDQINNPLAEKIYNDKELDSNEIIKDIDYCRSLIKDVSIILKCKCSDDTPFPKIIEKIYNINNLFLQLSYLYYLTNLEIILIIMYILLSNEK